MTGSELLEAAGLGPTWRQGTVDRTDDRRVHRVRYPRTTQTRGQAGGVGEAGGEQGKHAYALYASREDSTRLLPVVTSLRVVASPDGRNALRVEERRPRQRLQMYLEHQAPPAACRRLGVTP